jgi:hypothetical protein
MKKVDLGLINKIISEKQAKNIYTVKKISFAFFLIF